MLYCDQCAKVRKYPINELKVKGPCEICNKVIGPCNQMQIDELPLNNINSNLWETSSMIVEQLPSIPVDLSSPVISEGDNYKVYGEDLVITFPKADKLGRRRIRIVNRLEGERVQLTFKQERTSTNVGTVSAV